MADWFVEVHRVDDFVEVFEFIDYRKAVVFLEQYAQDEDGLSSVELVDREGRVLLEIASVTAKLSYSMTPRRAGVYRWDPRSEMMREVRQ